MNLPRIVGLNGLKRAGKDSIGSYLVREHGYTRLSFAEPLYEAVYALDAPVAWESPNNRFVGVQEMVDRQGWEWAKDHFSQIRRQLERLGTEVGRNLFGEDFWVEQAVAKIEDGKRYVFTDARFLNEFDAVADFYPDAYLLKVIRPGCTPNGHSSDRDWPNDLFDGSVMNDDTVEILEANVLDRLRAGR